MEDSKLTLIFLVLAGVVCLLLIVRGTTKLVSKLTEKEPEMINTESIRANEIHRYSGSLPFYRADLLADETDKMLGTYYYYFEPNKKISTMLLVQCTPLKGELKFDLECTSEPMVSSEESLADLLYFDVSEHEFTKRLLSVSPSLRRPEPTLFYGALGSFCTYARVKVSAGKEGLHSWRISLYETSIGSEKARG